MANENSSKQRNLWLEQLLAVVATINLLLVLFDLSYIPWRNFYLRRLPGLTHVYDQVKAIEPHRETEAYLQVVHTLSHQVSQVGLRSPEVATTLQTLQGLSAEMIDTNPFAAAGKSGTLEKIKNRMRDRTRETSAKRSFAIFWSQAYLLQHNWKQEINFFDEKIAPLIATNYYRRLGESGQFVDNFWRIDLPFVILFSLELLARSLFIKRRHPGFSWFNAILWRWYDLFLLIPFWRWLRFIPVLIRLDHAHVISLRSVRQQVHLGILSNFAEEITEIVVVRVINQIQGSIQRGELIRWLFQKQTQRPYIDINNLNEIEAIASILAQTIVYQVLPQIQPEITAILRHSIEGALSQSPIYRNLKTVPLVGQIQTDLSEQLAVQIATNLYNVLVRSMEDPVSAKLSSQLVERFSSALGSEIQKKHVLPEIQSLLLDFLEEVKLNYVQKLSEEEIAEILTQTGQLKTQVSIQPVVSSKNSAILPPE